MTDLVEFIEARLAEDEAAAHAAAAGGRWHYEDGDSVGAWTLYDEHWNIATLTTYEHSTYDYADRMPAARNPRYVDADANGRHIARHDPARVLRDVEAKRRLLAALADRRHFLDNTEWYGCRAVGEDDAPTGAACTCGRDEEVLQQLHLLAVPYSDHPDYRSEWAS